MKFSSASQLFAFSICHPAVAIDPGPKISGICQSDSDESWRGEYRLKHNRCDSLDVFGIDFRKEARVLQLKMDGHSLHGRQFQESTTARHSKTTKEGRK
jgi:hypothetical protein